MGGKGGGDSGAGAMLDYGNQALGLQKQIYDENKALIQPYATAGTAGLNELMRRMGLGGGAGTSGLKTEAQLRQELMPGYTTQGQTSNDAYYNNQNALFGLLADGANAARNTSQIAEARQRLADTKPTIGQNIVDNAGLDAAVAKALADQQAASTAAQSDPLYGSLLKSFGMEDYQADPGYQFRLSEGNKALERALASRGQFTSMNPAAAKALQEYGQQSASQEYGAAYDRYNMDQGNIFNRLASITGIGQNATGQLAGVGTNYANAGTDLYTGMGNAVTAAQQAKQANRGSMFNTLLGTGVSLAMAPTSGGGSLFGSLFR